jgi:Ca2+-transporting ATPase
MPHPHPQTISAANIWSLSPTEALKELDSDPRGLSDREVAKRQAKFGRNALEEDARVAHFAIFLNQFKSPLIYILLIAGIFTIALGEWVDAIVILAAVFLNSLLGYWQENKAANVLESLKAYVRLRCRVIRHGVTLEIDAAELVPGDIVHITQGDRVPADLRLLSAFGLEADEAILTGESLPSAKDPAPISTATPLPERLCMLHAGTLIVQGSAEAIVSSTGKNTEFGRIALTVKRIEHEPTPLQKAVSRFAGRASLALGVLTLIMFVWGVLAGRDVFEMLLVAVAVGVSAVPEGLPIALTVILAIGVERLAKQNGVVKKLLAAETLGSTSLILTDKTGTLTQAVMHISAVLPYGHSGDAATKNLLALALANTDVSIQNPEAPPEDWKVLGRPMESALVQDAAVEFGLKQPELQSTTEIVDRLPFNSKDKYSGALFRRDHGFRLAALGAPEIILGYCDLSAEATKAIETLIQNHAASGERVLGVAYADFAEPPRLRNGMPHNLVFAGLIAFRDPLRPGVKEEIRRIEQSGVKTVIVTGDHAGTATAIARELELLHEGDIVLTGQEIAALERDELLRLLDKVKVFARVTPEQKHMLANLYRSTGAIVAMTGDGVNDAPALQAADIGIAVGSGTEAAKSAADLILLKDDFGTIVTAIEQGRRILGNIRKVIVYLLSDAMGGLVLITGSLFAGLPIPMNALQILYINFFSDSFPAVTFAFEHLGSTHRRPKPGQTTVFDRDMRLLILAVGTLNSFLLFGLYAVLLWLGHPADLVRSFIFAAFGTYTLFVAFGLRSLRHPIWSYNPFDNRLLTTAVVFGIGLMLAALYFPPLTNILHGAPLPLPWLAAVPLVGLGGLAVFEIGKAYIRATTHR